MIENKPCKGQGKAHGFESCGKVVEAKTRKFGLCRVCYFDWMQTNESGKVHYQKQFLPKVKKLTEKEQKKKRIKEKEKMNVANLSADGYRAKILQPLFNKVARLIDQGHPCIATGNFGKMNGGHYISVGANRTTCINLHNIFIQSFESNHFKSGDTLKYQQGLREVFGIEYFEFVDSLRQIPPINFTKQDYIDLKPKVLDIIKTLEKDDSTRTPIDRIRLRNWVNNKLEIYPKEFSHYDID